MPVYRYSACSIATGEIKVETHEAVDKESIVDSLYLRGYKILKIEEVKKYHGSRSSRPVKLIDLYVFFKQFLTLIKAGIPLFRSVEIMIAQTKNRHLRAMIQTVKAELLEGTSLADCFKQFPLVFPSTVISMVAVGETKGNLDEAFDRIAESLLKRIELRNKIVNLLIYPLILIFCALTVLGIMITFVLPKFVDIFIQNEIRLPLITSVLLSVSQFITGHYVIIVGLILLLVTSLLLFRGTERGRMWIDALLFRCPVIGPIVGNLAFIRFARTLGTLYGSGVPLIRSLEMARDSLHNVYLVSHIDLAIQNVRDGKGLAKPLEESDVFPPIMIEMIGTGEETGTLDSLAGEAADFLERETEFLIRRKVAFIEPLTLILIGVIIAFIAVSFLLPISRMATMLRRP